MILLFLTGILLSESPFLSVPMKEVLEKAKTNEKLVFVDFYTEWCGPCKLLDRTTWKDERVIAYLNENMVCLKIDAEKGEGKTLAVDYGVQAYPCLLILKPDGTVVDRFFGYMPPAAFLNWMRNAVN